jgi:transglutaminase-like putative cysteine protease
MFNFHKILLLISFLFLFQNFSYSQDPPIEWGEIPKVDLEMKSFPSDTNATAVILCDYGESYINDDFNVEFNRIVRIKILNSKGFDWGTQSIVLYSKDAIETLHNLKGMTYNLDENGKVIKSELDDDDVFKEEVDENRTRYRFTLPNLKPGSVIEISYNIMSKSLFLIQDWTFQHSEPTVWSEYKISFPPNIIYSGVNMGYEPWYYNQTEDVNKYYSGYAGTFLGGSQVKCHQFHYIVKDAPAVREEPYITTTDDYVNKVNIQLSAYLFPSTGRKDVFPNWKSFVSDLSDADYFSNKIDVTGDIEELAAKITNGLSSPEEKMNAIYNWVSKSIVWDGKNRFGADKDVDDVLEQKKGNSSEITFLLLSLLKSAGIDGHPVILSTRDNGKIQELYPIVMQFNYNVAKVKIGNKTYFLDATNPLRPLNVLPKKILGVKGLVIKDMEDEDPLEWVTFSADKPDINKTLINVKINLDGSLTGNIEDAYGEYTSLSARENLNGSGMKDMDLAKELFDSETQGFNIDSVLIKNKDNLELPVKVITQISSSIYAQKSGDMIYINPFLVHHLKENPFKLKNRKFPVDYGYKRSNDIIINFILPDGYELKEKLAPKVYTVGNNLFYSRQILVQGNIVQIASKMDIKSSVIKPNQYDELRNFYSQIVSIQSEQLVIGPKENNTNSKSAAKSSEKASLENK